MSTLKCTFSPVPMPKADVVSENPQKVEASRMFEIIRNELGADHVVSADNNRPVAPIVEVKSDQLKNLALLLRDHEELKFQSLLVVSATDFPKSESNDDERIEVFYSVYSYKIHQQLDFKCKLDRNNPQVASLSDVYRSANWYERESYDLVGVDFVGHPYQKRILLPTDWVGHPLRKDYEFPEEYNGMKVPL